MLERVPAEEIELTHEMFSKSLSILEKKVGSKYNYITKGGRALKAALFQLFKTAWKTEKLPDEWRKTTIVQIPKGKADSADLDFRRNIHLKSDIYKQFGLLVINEIKSELFNNMSKFQLGTKPGHRSQEHIYAKKSN